ncbi:hypothetical protein [Acinetobacter sp. YH16038]|uniref:hypothetical protein n=1 Tax=Acinetobacter sp. YH16038 TaxID=2601183 RepID=UPI0015D10B16|nr:hypothetical protein [Acinetobacter sp. YH16038]
MIIWVSVDLVKIRVFLFVSVLISLIFFALSYCYYYLETSQRLPLERAVSITFSFIGSIGTIASIIFALYFYNKQQEGQKKLIGSNQPIFILTTSALEKSTDSTRQPSYSFDINIKNFGHLASSFSLVNVGSAEGLDSKIIIEIPDAFVSLFNRDDSHSFRVNISNIFDIQSYPNTKNISFDLLLSYMDKFNSSRFKVYALSINEDGEPKLMPLKDHHLLSFNG